MGGKNNRRLLGDLSDELQRIDAQDVKFSLDEEFDPQAGTLLKVAIGTAYWHLMPEEFHSIIRDIPDGSGSEALKRAIETEAMHVWHGPSPTQTRDTSP